MRKLMSMLALLSLAVGSLGTAWAVPWSSEAFRALWLRTEHPVAQHVVDRSWLWGPEPFTQGLHEWYVEGQDQRRLVQYLDKGRMELSPLAPAVTSGLLVREMITGEIQVGENKSIWRGFSRTPIVGDPSNVFPTYTDMIKLYETSPRYGLSQHADLLFAMEGTATLTHYSAAAETEIVHVAGDRGIPRVFWDFLNQGGMVFEQGQHHSAERLFDWLPITGFPITDAVWVRVLVGGVEREVLVQAYERRVLSYTPSNPDGWRVEMGNVGQHYYAWRYLDLFETGRHALLTSPSDGLGETVTSPLVVQGFEDGTAFEGQLLIRLLDAHGQVIAQQPTRVHRPDVALAGPFEATLMFTPPPSNTHGTIEVLAFLPGDDTPQVLETTEVILKGR